ncbi:hypothetical protein ACIBF6_38395 [Streptosporangium amethystogenes]|uniref:hypothetical protein n=1 Tax=Streptosporangium amethystogenes TaxID=2002 RepID=UPI0037BD44B0
MRIRMLAAAVVTAGALMATLTGAASADGTPTPAPREGTVQIQCEGGGQVTLTTRRLTEAEIKELEKAGASPAVPAVPAVPSGRAGEAAVPSGVKVLRGVRVEGEDAKELLPLPEGVTPGKEVKVMAAPSGTAAPGAPEAGVVTVTSEAVPERVEGAERAEKVEGAERAEGPEDVAVMVMSTPSGDAPSVTCAKAKKE